MNETIIQRIKKIIDANNMSITSLSNKLNIVQTTLNRQLSGETSSIPVGTIEAILHYFPDVSAEWLLRGTGEMQLSNNSQPQQENNTPAIINGKFEVDEKGYLRLKFNKI